MPKKPEEEKNTVVIDAVDEEELKAAKEADMVVE